jgi:methyl-accepting chemotaxis protein
VRDRNVQFKISATAVLCFALGIVIILCTQFFYLRAAFTDSTKEVFREEGEQYAYLIKDQLSMPLSFLGGVTGIFESWIESGKGTEREVLQGELFHTFAEYSLSEGSAFMLEPNVFDGKDAEYANSAYGTEKSGRISFYFYRDEDGKTMWQPYTEEGDLEFVQPYYTDAQGAMGPTYSEPYLYELNGNVNYMVTASYPLIDSKGKFLGVMTSDLYLDTIHKSLSKRAVYKTGYIVVVSEKGNLLFAPGSDKVGKPAAEFGYDYPLPGADEDVKYGSAVSTVNGKPCMVATVRSDLGIPGGVYYISIVVPNNEANAVYIRLLWISAGIFFAVGLAIARTISRRTRAILKPLAVMTELIGHFGETGSLTYSGDEWVHTHDAASSNDDIGRSLKLLLKMFGRLVYYGKAITALAEHNVAVEIEMLSEDDTIGNALTKLTDNLNEILSQIGNTSSSVETLARQVADGSDRIAGGAAQQNSGVKSLMDSVTAVKGQTKENTKGAEEALAFTEEAGDKMATSMEHMGNLGCSMQDIMKAQSDIGGIIKIIDEIAFQTNILALNAAVEAARAGQHGRGFAVVADEVRSLAVKSADAARMTTELISSSLALVEEGNRFATLTGDNINEMSERTSQIVERIKLIAEASIRQREDIERINDDIEIISFIVTENASAASLSAEQSRDLTDQASVLSSIIARFELK